jgi:hypothetical protein
MNSSQSSGRYKVLSPWADVDPIPVKGISPRVISLAGKKIGLFCNFKPGARPILSAVEAKLKERYPSIKTSQFVFLHNICIDDSEEKASFDRWLKEVDTVINAVGD